MTNNMNYIMNTVTGIIYEKFKDEIPSLEDIFTEAETIRTLFQTVYPVSDEEFEQIKNELLSNIHHKIGQAITLHGEDSAHQSWYLVHESDNFYWNRYKNYLINQKHWSREIVNRLNETTNNIMDDLGNPNDSSRAFQRRGLLLGDVQSGKTATYTAICNKAADAGYRVIIVLAGMMENLRIQTQERLDAEFVGYESKYILDKKAAQEIKNNPVGVGRNTPKDLNKRIACFTSVATDFKIPLLRSLGLSLKTLNGTALFVVKKNKSVLNNLYNWLIGNNAEYETKIIDLPLLLIDDEADNASVNTNSEEKDPTAINKAIREILSCFRQASYLGITATPFANIFIDPEPNNDTKDLFPKDFLTVLPTPEHYIGADKIFGIGNADSWENEESDRTGGTYKNAIIPIKNTEQENFFVFKHKKEIADTLTDLPDSLKEAIQYFILITAISDTRKDHNEHRSMLVNVSRYTSVQNKTAELIKNFLYEIKSDLENYSQLPLKQSIKIPSINMLHHIWDKYKLNELTQIIWSDFLKESLFKAAKRIEVRSVNQQHGASSLNYYEYKNTGFRVIAVGGNSLSRGLTLEGLCVSYFYRNTMMYDTLLQMGRWFGYRPRYDDLFKIWIAEDAIGWYGYITDAVNELKDELKKMEQQNQTPEEFGLKVRQAPGSLLITAQNKMRSAVSVIRPISVSGRMIETPRLKGDKNTIQENEKLCRSFLKNIDTDPNISPVKYDEFTKAYIWQNVPKKLVADLVRNFKTHPWNLNFQPSALYDYISDDSNSLEFWDVAIPEGKKLDDSIPISLSNTTITIAPEKRSFEWDGTIKNLLRVSGHHVRVGSGGCSKIGLDKDTIQKIRKDESKITDRSYLIKTRKPLALIHILKNTVPADERNENDPNILFALGLGFPDDGFNKTAKYSVNINELKNWIDETDGYDEDDFN